MTRAKQVFLLTGVVALIGTGCATEHRHYRDRERVRAIETREVVVTQTPPANVQEMVPASPGPGYVWAPGYWVWQGNQWAWQPGHYMVAPVGRVAWDPGHWERRGGGWVWQPGHWR